MFRTYSVPVKTVQLEQPIGLYAKGSKENMADRVKHSGEGIHYIEEMKTIFLRDGYKPYLKLDIWDNPYLKAAGIHPRLPLRYRLLHWYLRRSQKFSDCVVIKLFDKALKRII